MANWNDLPLEMKEMVVKRMNLETRTQLKQCSKADKDLVASIRINKLNIKVKSMVHLKINVKLHRDELDKSDIDLSIWNYRSKVVIKNLNTDDVDNAKHWNCSSGEEAKKWLEQMFASIVSSFSFDSVYVEIDAPDFIENPEFTIHTNYIHIKGSASPTIGLLKNVAPRVKSVNIITYYNEKLEDIANIPAVVNAKNLEVFGLNDINDEQLLNLNCTSWNFDCKSNITAKGINQLIKKAITNNHLKGSIIVFHIDENVIFQTWEDIIEGLDVEVTESEDVTLNDGQVKFGKRRGRIQMNHGKWMNLYQLNNFGMLQIKIHQ